MAITTFVLTFVITCGFFLFGENLLYRIIAIVALALSLLSTSYLYQRFRAAIMTQPVHAEERDTVE